MERGMTVDQVLGAVWRRRAVAGAVAAVTLAVGAAVVLGTPKTYRASSVVRVETQRPTEELVHRSVGDGLETRLLALRQELLGRPVLQRVIEEINLYPEIVSSRGMEAAIERMRSDLDVKVEGEAAFELTYSAGDADLAARVANRIPQVFAEEAVRARTQQAERATQLFGAEVDRLKAALSNWERQIAQFKVDHLGELPEQLETNMRGMERLAAMLQTKSEELRMAEGRRSDLARARLSGDSEAGRLATAENGLVQQLVSARATWTEDHPEVQRLDTELNAMRTKRQDAEGRMFAERQERARATTLVGIIQSEMEDIRKQMDVFQQRLERTPRWAHELGVIERDHEIAKTKYQSVISRKVEAELAQELEARAAPSMFRVVSPAMVPTVAAKPDRMGGLLIASIVALLLGVLTAVVLELRDDSIRDSSELKGRVPVPVLAVVPQLDGRTERRVLVQARPDRNTVAPTTLN